MINMLWSHNVIANDHDLSPTANVWSFAMQLKVCTLVNLNAAIMLAALFFSQANCVVDLAH